MSKKTLFSRIKEAKNFYVALAAIGLLSITLLLLPYEFGQRLGEALLVAVILAGTVDTYLKSRLAEEVVRDISPYVMAYALPEKLRNEVAQLCSIDYFRTKFSLSYELSGMTNQPGQVLLKATLDYTVVNLHDDYVPCCHYIWVEKCYEANGELKQIGWVGAQGVWDDKRRPMDYNEDGDKSAGDEDGGKCWKRDSFIAPKSMPPARFWHSTFQILPVEHYEWFISRVPIVGATVRVQYPEWLEVNVQFEHRLEKQVERRQQDTTSTIWEFSPALLPYSTISATWKRKL